MADYPYSPVGWMFHRPETNHDLGDEPPQILGGGELAQKAITAPAWPTPVAWEDLKEGETYFICWRGMQYPPGITSGFRVRKDFQPEWFDSCKDPQCRPMIYGDDETETGKQKAAAAMQILLQEWVSRG